jgi:transposase-like protein
MARAARTGKKGGRPSKYRAEYARQAREMCALGASDRALAKAFGVDASTIGDWRKLHEEFDKACRKGKDTFDTESVERALHKRATGYRYTEVTKEYAVSPKTGQLVLDSEGKPQVVVKKVRKEAVPDTAAAKFWLANRNRKRWREITRIEHTDGDGQPLKMVMNLGGEG